MNIFSRFLFIVAVILSAGCATNEPLQGASDQRSVSKVYQINIRQTERLATESLLGLKLEVKAVRTNIDKIEIEFSKPVSAFSWGEVGIVVLQSITADSTEVSVRSSKRVKTQITGASTEDFAKAIFEGIDYAVNRR